MRTDAGVLSSLVQQAAALTTRQAEIARQLSTGTRLTSLANDPAAAAASVRLTGSIGQLEGDSSAWQTVAPRLQSADGALGAVVERLTAAVGEAVRGANGTLSQGDRATIALQLRSISDSVLSLANSSYDGAYLFSGTAAVEPFQKSADAVTYAGDSGHTTVAVQGGTLASSLSGAAVFGSGWSSVFAQLETVAATLDAGDAPSSGQIAGLRDCLQNVIVQRSALAAGTARLQEAHTYAATQQASLEAARTTLAASDPVALATELSASETQRSALLSSLAILEKGSLFDYL